MAHLSPTHPTPSTTHCVLMPSYNSGHQLAQTVRHVVANWLPLWVVIDGSTDESVSFLTDFLTQNSHLSDHVHIIRIPNNQGKGAAVLTGMLAAEQQGYTHALTIDADGQHPPELIPAFMTASLKQPTKTILGKPVFDAHAPKLRVYGRKISNAWANLETLWMGIGDSLYGFRVYPIAPLRQIMQHTRWMRRFDFDPEAVVRLCWAGVYPLNLPAPVRYLSAGEGGISHFNYLRDNVLLIGMHSRLILGFAFRLPSLLSKRLLRLVAQ